MPDSDMQPRPIAEAESPPRPKARCSSRSIVRSSVFADRGIVERGLAAKPGEEHMAETRVALITGCGKPIGIGNSTARALAAAGVIVVVADIAAAGVANEHNAQGDVDASWGGIDSLVAE